MNNLNIPYFMNRPESKPKTLGYKPDGLDVPEFSPAPAIARSESVHTAKPVKKASEPVESACGLPDWLTILLGTFGVALAMIVFLACQLGLIG